VYDKHEPLAYTTEISGGEKSKAHGDQKMCPNAQPLHCQQKSLLTSTIGGTTGDRHVAKMLTLTENGGLVGWGQLLMILLLILQ
jgi:hypothetical protein